MTIVRCNRCGNWVGFETELVVRGEEEYCPKCGSNSCLEDCHVNTSYGEEEIKELWNLFGDIPINDDDEILESFLEFEAGTDRFMIWTWFDYRYPGGVYKLINDAWKVS